MADLGITHVVVSERGLLLDRPLFFDHPRSKQNAHHHTLLPPQSVLNGPAPALPPSVTASTHIDLVDEVGGDLLAALPPAVAALAAARAAASRLLIHCAAGTSRSVAVAAGVLMACEGLDAAAATAAVAAAVPGGAPNDGFASQLALWGEMGCALDRGHPRYRAHVAGMAGDRVLAGGSAGPLPDAGGGTADAAATPPHTVYRCRACRRLVATSDNTVPLDGAADAAAGARFRGKRRGAATGGVATAPPPTAPPPPLGTDGSSLYVEPLAWMADALADGGVAGKLNCPGCAARLGAFDWAGGQTVGGGWVTPCFRLHLSRLDAMTGGGGDAGGVAAAAVRAPRLA